MSALFLSELHKFQDGVTSSPDWELMLATVPGLVEFVKDWIAENRPFPGPEWKPGKLEAWRIEEAKRPKLTREQPKPQKRGKQMELGL